MPGMLIFIVTSQLPCRIGDCVCASDRPRQGEREQSD